MSEKKVIVQVDDVTIRFNLANQKVDNLKEYVIKALKKQLRFQEFFAVKNVSFQVREGEAWGLIGVNGSGKSTMLKTISGILKPYKGSVTVDGSIAPLIELGAGFDPDMTARENIFLNGCVLGHTKKFMQEHFDEIVDFAEIHKFLDSPIKNYSSGMRARLGFAVATSAIVPGVDPAVLLSSLGLYELYVAALADLDFSILLPMVMGLAVGAVVVSFLMSRLLKRFHTAAFSVIFGVFLAMIPRMLTPACRLPMAPISLWYAALIVMGFCVSYFLGRMKKE
jgi:hypothetical protein